MSDFFNNFWSVYIAAVSLIGILGCFLLLVLVARRKVVPSADNTTGHVWDEDLRELNNPMPKWWMGLFVITVVFSLAYLVAYPGLGSFKGELDWTQYGAYDKEMEKARVDLEPMYAKFVSMPTEEMARDPQAMAIGERLFMNNCAQCHGSDARGSKSFPNLSDGDWLHGGTPDKIKETITNGRIGVMPPMAAAVGSAEDVRNVAHYVLSLSGSPHDAVRASQGKSKFVACAACHGMDGKGNQALGAPNLTDDIWLHGWGESVIVDMVNHGKMNEMPAQKDKLTEAQIAVLAAYVWGLSNASGQK
ncbi:cytochrome-c oxidase, cbb3-type subunit III [Comamonas testosteroni]|uniref:cytochrome-c oxidase, cbb3-type subunit III n=1 Tax=Comamonas testosteroni TaxID=285 RepID=UPI0005B4FF61|nr:cytochrome-c oxidase, cbb3-type subunit III [Comamonas testosteroni]